MKITLNNNMTKAGNPEIKKKKDSPKANEKTEEIILETNTMHMPTIANGKTALLKANILAINPNANPTKQKTPTNKIRELIPYCPVLDRAIKVAPGANKIAEEIIVNTPALINNPERLLILSGLEQ
jgi:hypothetical protein